jgi:hypothetical protein
MGAVSTPSGSEQPGSSTPEEFEKAAERMTGDYPVEFTRLPGSQDGEGGHDEDDEAER